MKQLLDVIKLANSWLNLIIGKVNLKEQVYVAHQKLARLSPFYMSLQMNSIKLCNCILELGATNNIIPLKVAQILKLNYTKCEDTFFQMDSSNVKIVVELKLSWSIYLHP